MGPNKSGLLNRWIYLVLCVGLAGVLVLCIFALTRSNRAGLAVSSQNKRAKAVEKSGDSNDVPAPKQEVKVDSNVPPSDHNHPAFDERVREREDMVARYIEREDIDDPNVLSAMRTVPRHAFVRQQDQRRAYANHPLPIGLNQTISQPYIVAYMTEVLKLGPNSKVFEVGTGSGYQAAVCAEIARQVYSVEILEELALSAKRRLKELGYRNITVRQADGYFGWKGKGPFDAIIVTAAAGLVPPPLIEQLKPGGKMILPLGSPYGLQTLVLITKDDEGKVHSKRLLPVRFVPMTGRTENQ